MSNQIRFECSEHPDPFSCPDKLVHYSDKFKEYGIIIHDGGSSISVIHYCPWCGEKLPKSVRDQYFDEVVV